MKRQENPPPKKKCLVFCRIWVVFFFQVEKPALCLQKVYIKTYKNQSLSKRNLIHDWSNVPRIRANVPPLETRVFHKVIIEGVSRCLRSPDQFGRKCRKGGGGTLGGYLEDRNTYEVVSKPHVFYKPFERGTLLLLLYYSNN